MKRFALAIALCLAIAAVPPSAVAQEAVIAVVNDHPVTGFDVDQRIKLMKLLGINDPARLGRKAAASSLIDDYIKIDEAKTNKIDPNESDIDERMRNMASALKTDEAGLKSRLASAGLTLGALRQFAAAQMSISRLMQTKYHEKFEVNQAAIDKKFSAIKNDINGKVAQAEADPRRQPVLVLTLQEINFPAENDPTVLQSRAIEANQAVAKLKSCAGIKGAIAGIFNVQIGRKIEADAKKLPPPLMAQLKQRGVGHAIGPMRYPQGVQILAYCGQRTITPPKIVASMPTRQQIESLAMNEQFDAAEKKHLAEMRKTAIIEYKDPSYAP